MPYSSMGRVQTQALEKEQASYGPGKGRRQNSLPPTTNFSKNVTEPSKGISYPVSDLCQCFTKLTGPPIHYIVILYPQPMVQMTFCDLSHTFHKQVTNVSQCVFVILLWGILMSPVSTGLNTQVGDPCHGHWSPT